MRTNINIINKNFSCGYVIDYDRDRSVTKRSDAIYQSLTNGSIVLSMDEAPIIKHNGQWVVLDENCWMGCGQESCRVSKLILYFPQFSVDVYNPGVIYNLNAETWINGKQIILGSWLIRRSDALAASSVQKYMNREYYECVELDIVDPYSLIYSDDWKDFRKTICGEIYDEDERTLNNTGSVIYFSLHPVELSDEGALIDCGDWVGGQNSINISKDNSGDYLTLHISSNTKEDLCGAMPSINCNVKFNSIYGDDLSEYLKETYNLDVYGIQYGIAIGNENDLYFVGESEIFQHDHPLSYSFTKDYILSNDNFKDWTGWQTGINIVCSLNVLSEDGESIVYLLSNPLPLTQDLYKYFVNGDWNVGGKPIYNINLNLIDMKVYNINAVNKIEQNVIQMSRTDSSDNKKNIIQPVFFRVTDSQNLIIHPAVIETISINLDAYKSKVKSFKLKIEDATFVEIGRVASGVLFKVIGNKLAKATTSGNYYILNENGEMVTTGKYKYSM